MFKGWGTRDEILLELIKLNQQVLREREVQYIELSRQIIRMETRIMGQFESLTAKVDQLKTEVAEIVDFVNNEAGKLATLFAENVALTARIAELEPNQITAEDRAALADNEASIQSAIDTLNTFTPETVPVPEG